MSISIFSKKTDTTMTCKMFVNDKSVEDFKRNKSLEILNYALFNTCIIIDYHIHRYIISEALEEY